MVLAQLVEWSLYRGPQIESSHRQKFILNICCQLLSSKEAGNGPFVKKSGTLKMAQLPNT